MATKLIVLYTQPENPEDFDRQYFQTHVPLAEKMPGLRRMEVSKITGNMMGGSSPYYMIAELLFDNAEALNAAMSSPEGKAAGKNIMGFAANYITMLTSEVAQPEQVGAY
jgi:uncharacterized protein (TIGR02118 family)